MCHLVLLLPVLALPVFWLWPLSIAVPVYGLAVAFSIALYLLAMKTMSMPRLNGSDGIVGRTGRVVEIGARGVTLRLGGEYGPFQHPHVDSGGGA
jgi:inner membrane protein